MEIETPTNEASIQPSLTNKKSQLLVEDTDLGKSSPISAIGDKKINRKKTVIILTKIKATFFNRRAGLLKKAYELADMCGIKIALIFTDLKDNLHTFINDEKFEIDFGSRIINNKNKVTVYKYRESDVITNWSENFKIAILFF